MNLAVCRFQRDAWIAGLPFFGLTSEDEPKGSAEDKRRRIALDLRSYVTITQRRCVSFGQRDKAELSSGRSNSFIKAQYCKVWDGRAADDCTRNVQRIKCADQFGGKGQARTANDVGAKSQNVPVVACADQTGAARGCSFRGDFIQHASPNKDPLAFHHREIGCKNDVRIA